MTSTSVELHSDLWYKIMAYLSHRDLLQSCMPVCRSWRSAVLDLTSGGFNYPAQWESENSDNNDNNRPLDWGNLHLHVASIQAYLLPRASRLRGVTMKFTSGTSEDVQKIIDVLSDCKQLQSVDISETMHTIDLSKLPTSTKDLEIFPDIEAALSMKHTQPLWTFSDSALPNLTHLRTQAGRHEHAAQIAQLTSLQNLELWCFGPEQNLNSLSALTKLKFLCLGCLDTISTSVQELLLSLPLLETATFSEIRELHPDFTLHIAESHPGDLGLVVKARVCSSRAFATVQASPMVKCFNATRIDDFEAIFPLINWSAWKVAHVSLPCMKELVVDWARILTAPNLKTLQLRASGTLHFESLQVLSKSALESKGLNFTIALIMPFALFMPFAISMPLGRVSPEVCSHFKNEGLYQHQRPEEWIFADSSQSLEFL